MENTGGHVPSSVYAQGCGSFSNGSNNYNPTPSTPPSYTPPTPPAPAPNKYPEGVYLGNPKTLKLNQISTEMQYGYDNFKTPPGKLTIVQLAIAESKNLINWINNSQADVQFCLVQKGWVDRLAWCEGHTLLNILRSQN